MAPPLVLPRRGQQSAQNSVLQPTSPTTKDALSTAETTVKTDLPPPPPAPTLPLSTAHSAAPPAPALPAANLQTLQNAVGKHQNQPPTQGSGSKGIFNNFASHAQRKQKPQLAQTFSFFTNQGKQDPEAKPQPDLPQQQQQQQQQQQPISPSSTSAAATAAATRALFLRELLGDDILGDLPDDNADTIEKKHNENQATATFSAKVSAGKAGAENPFVFNDLEADDEEDDHVTLRRLEENVNAFQDCKMVQDAISKGMDPREYAESLEARTAAAEEALVRDYIARMPQLRTLEQRISECDTMLERMATMVSGFQDTLATVTKQISALYNKNAALCLHRRNASAAASKLAAVIDGMVVPPATIRAIAGPSKGNTDLRDFAKHVSILHARMTYVKANKASGIRAFSDIGPELEKLRHRCAERIRDTLADCLKQASAAAELNPDVPTSDSTIVDQASCSSLENAKASSSSLSLLHSYSSLKYSALDSLQRRHLIPLQSLQAFVMAWHPNVAIELRQQYISFAARHYTNLFERLIRLLSKRIDSNWFLHLNSQQANKHSSGSLFNYHFLLGHLSDDSFSMRSKQQHTVRQELQPQKESAATLDAIKIINGDEDDNKKATIQNDTTNDGVHDNIEEPEDDNTNDENNAEKDQSEKNATEKSSDSSKDQAEKQKQIEASARRAHHAIGNGSWTSAAVFAAIDRVEGKLRLDQCVRALVRLLAETSTAEYRFCTHFFRNERKQLGPPTVVAHGVFQEVFENSLKQIAGVIESWATASTDGIGLAMCAAAQRANLRRLATRGVAVPSLFNFMASLLQVLVARYAASIENVATQIRRTTAIPTSTLTASQPTASSQHHQTYAAAQQAGTNATVVEHTKLYAQYAYVILPLGLPELLPPLTLLRQALEDFLSKSLPNQQSGTTILIFNYDYVITTLERAEKDQSGALVHGAGMVSDELAHWRKRLARRIMDFVAQVSQVEFGYLFDAVSEQESLVAETGRADASKMDAVGVKFTQTWRTQVANLSSRVTRTFGQQQQQQQSATNAAKPVESGHPLCSQIMHALLEQVAAYWQRYHMVLEKRSSGLLQTSPSSSGLTTASASAAGPNGQGQQQQQQVQFSQATAQAQVQSQQGMIGSGLSQIIGVPSLMLELNKFRAHM